MNIQHRADVFATYVALELKGKITTMGFTANQVADAIERPRATMNRWLNGKLPLPLSVLAQAAEAIGVDPQSIVGTAYDRVCFEFGELDGTSYTEKDDRNDDTSNLLTGAFGPRELDKKQPPARMRDAAMRGRRAAEVTPHAE